MRDEPAEMWIFFHKWGLPIWFRDYKIIEILADRGYQEGVERTGYFSPITENLRYTGSLADVQMHLDLLPGTRLTWIKWAHALKAMHEWSLTYETTEFEFIVGDREPIATGFVKKLRR